MNWGTLEESDFLSTLIAEFCCLHLKHYADALYEEDEAEYRDKQFLMDDNSRYGNDSANGK